MKLEVKKLNERAKISKAYKADAGLDLSCVSIQTSELFIEYATGIAVNIPEGYVGLLFPRSSVSKKSLIMANCVGVVDAGYLGEIKVRMRKLNTKKFLGYSVGDRIAQLVIMPLAGYEINMVKEFSGVSDRDSGGFGSSGD